MRHDIAADLDNCIDALRRGKTLDECLAMYPDAASELAPLLMTADRLRTAPKIQARETAMRAGKNVFLAEAARLRERKQRSSSKPWQRLSIVASWTFAWPRPRPLALTPAVSTVVALVLILCSGTTAIAASRSLPDQPLYGVKLAAEQVQLALTSDPMARADLTLSIAEKRVDEVSSLSAAGRSINAPAIQRLAAGSQEALKTIARIDESDMRPLLYRYLSIVSAEQAVLTKVKPAPEDARTVAEALASAEAGEHLAAAAVTNPGVLKEEVPQQDAPRTGRAPIAAVLQTPTQMPTPDARRMRTPAPSPTATSQPVQPAGTATKPPAPSPTATNVAPSPVLPPAAANTATAAPLIQFSGVIETIGAAQWTVAGQSIAIDGETTIGGATPRAGARADVTAVAIAGQGLRARSIRVQPLVEIPAAPSTVCGAIESVGATSWTIGGQIVMINSNTLVSGVPAVGSTAEATGWRKGDIFTATSIIVKAPVGAVASPTMPTSPIQTPPASPSPVRTAEAAASPSATTTPTRVLTPVPSTPTATPQASSSPTPTQTKSRNKASATPSPTPGQPDLSPTPASPVTEPVNSPTASPTTSKNGHR